MICLIFVILLCVRVGKQSQAILIKRLCITLLNLRAKTDKQQIKSKHIAL